MRAPDELVIYRLIVNNNLYDTKTPPFDVDFITGLTNSLYKKVSSHYGQPVSTKYYATYVTQEQADAYNANKAPEDPDLVPGLDDLAVEIEWTFDRNLNGFLYHKRRRYYWYKEDGSRHLICKDRDEHFDLTDDEDMNLAVKESRQRRGNIVDTLQYKILALMQTTIPLMDPGDLATMGLAGLSGDALALAIVEHGRQFIDTIAADITSYVHYNTTTLDTNLAGAHTAPANLWLLNEVAPGAGTTIQQLARDSINIPAGT